MNARKTELAELVAAYLENRLSEGEAEELRQQLRLSHEARLLFWDCVEQHALLEEVLGENRGRDLALFEVQDARHVPADEVAATPAVLPAGRRPRTWLPWVSALATLAAGILCAVWSQPSTPVPPHEGPPQPAVGRVELVAGDIRVTDPSGQFVVATAGLVLRPGQIIDTGDDESLAELHLTDGTQVTLSSGSSLRLPIQKRTAESEPIHLERGAMRVQIPRQPGTHPMSVATEHGRITSREGRFRLYREEKSSRVEVEDGLVSLLNQNNDRILDERSFVVATSEPEPMVSRALPAARCRLRHTFLHVGDGLALATDGSRLVTNHHKHGLRVWNLADGDLLTRGPGSRESVSDMALAPNGQVVTLLSQAGTAIFWKLGDSTTSPTRLRDSGLRQSTVSADGRWLVQGIGARTGEVALWEADPENGRISLRRSLAIKPTRVALSRDGAYFAVNQWAGETSIWEVSTGRKVAQHVVAGTAALALAPDGGTLAAYSVKEGLILFNREKGSRQVLWPNEGARVCHLLFSTDGRVVLAALNDGTVRAWASDDGRSLLVLETGHRTVLKIAASSDLSVLATLGDQDCVKVWECKLP